MHVVQTSGSRKLLRLFDGGLVQGRLRAGVVERAAAAVGVEERRVDAAQEPPEDERVKVGTQLNQDSINVLQTGLIGQPADSRVV